MKVVFLYRATIAPQIKVRRPGFPHEWREYDRTSVDQIVERAQDADIIILNKVNLRAETLAQLPHLKCVAVAATGSDCIDKKAAAAQGVIVTNIRDYARATVPEHVFALILALSRSIVPYRADVLEGEWQRAAQFCFFNNPISDLAGKRLGVVGAGSLGGRVGEIGRAFGMDVVFSRRAQTGAPDTISFQELIETSDVITLHCPLTDETRGLISDAQFAAMKRKPILINTARGGLVDEAALERALDRGLIRAAGVDVTLPEPPAADGIIMRIAARKNVILTPHTAWASEEAQQTLADQLIENVEAFARGAPRNIV